MAVNFELITDLQQITRRDFAIAVPTLLNPTNANPLIDGEWLNLNASYQLERGTDDGTVNAMILPSFPLFAERGRYDTQAIGKSPVLFLGMYEAQTRVATLAGMAVGDVLEVGDQTVDSLTRKGLQEITVDAGQHLTIGMVTRIVGTGASQKVRFIHKGWDWKTV